tara:strand:+ start:294 stop:1226 length:933 start_codon:yes stop_codon:yes gene_type:complete
LPQARHFLPSCGVTETRYLIGNAGFPGEMRAAVWHDNCICVRRQFEPEAGMTAQGIGGTYRAGLMQRLFGKADQDQNQLVNATELAGVMSGDDTAKRAAAIIAANDADGDGQLTVGELSTGKFAPETLAGLLSIQEYAEADRANRQADDQNAVDEFFAHADVDGDGKLSKDEFDAERTLRMAQSLDAGEAAPQHMFVALRGAADDGVITRDELMVGRRLADVAKAVWLNDPDLDPEFAARLKALQPQMAEPGTGAEPPAQSETPAPPAADTTTVLGDAVRSAELTQTLIARLIRQLEMASPTAPTQELSA